CGESAIVNHEGLISATQPPNAATVSGRLKKQPWTISHLKANQHVPGGAVGCTERTGTTKRIPSAEASSPPPKAFVSRSAAWTSTRRLLAVVIVSARI